MQYKELMTAPYIGRHPTPHGEPRMTQRIQEKMMWRRFICVLGFGLILCCIQWEVVAAAKKSIWIGLPIVTSVISLNSNDLRQVAKEMKSDLFRDLLAKRLNASSTGIPKLKVLVTESEPHVFSGMIQGDGPLSKKVQRHAFNYVIARSEGFSTSHARKLIQERPLNAIEFEGKRFPLSRTVGGFDWGYPYVVSNSWFKIDWEPGFLESMTRHLNPLEGERVVLFGVRSEELIVRLRFRMVGDRITGLSRCNLPAILFDKRNRVWIERNARVAMEKLARDPVGGGLRFYNLFREQTRISNGIRLPQIVGSEATHLFSGREIGSISIFRQSE